MNIAKAFILAATCGCLSSCAVVAVTTTVAGAAVSVAETVTSVAVDGVEFAGKGVIKAGKAVVNSGSKPAETPPSAKPNVDASTSQ
jgi:hypothetical protein